jgi:hypothetical protein
MSSRRLLSGGAFAVLVVAGLGLWLGGRASVPPAPGPPPAVAAPPPSAERAPPPAAARFEPAPGARRVTKKRAPASAAPAEPHAPSLDELLRLPGPLPAGPESIDWAGARDEVEAESSQAAGPRRLRVDYSRENMTEGVPMQPERSRTEVGVSVRVDDADRVRVRGGVRVDERRADAEAEPETDRTPTLGVEVRF